MVFEDLKSFFDSKCVELYPSSDRDEFPSSLKGKLIVFGKSEGSPIVSIKIKGNTNEFNERLFFCKTVDEKYNAVIDKAMKGNYFAKAIEFDKEKIVVEIVFINEMASFTEDNKFEIAITDSALKSVKVETFKKDFYNDFIFFADGKKYYVFGKHIHSPSKQFAIVCSKGLLDVLRKKRKDCSKRIDSKSKNGEEEIYAIDFPLKPYDAENYRFFLSEADIVFDDVSSTGVLSKQNAAFVGSGLEKFVKSWSLYSDTEFKYVSDIKESAGSLKYGSYEQNINDFEFSIENPGNLEFFLEEKRKIASDDDLFGDVQAEGLVYLRGKELFVTVSLRYKGMGSKPNSIICQRIDETKSVPKEGNITVCIKGCEMQYCRRKAAIDRILKGASAKPNLAMLLAGESGDVVKNTKDYFKSTNVDLKKIFGGKEPTKKQKEAIKIAVNTPDFAIIQGPPGTGKTKVINAIQQVLGDIERDKTIAFGKNILTAYQKQATKNLAKNLEVYGLPTISVFGGDKIDSNVLELEFSNWLKEKQKELIYENPTVSLNVAKKRDRERFNGILVRFDVNSYTYEKDYSELKTLRETVSDEIIGYFRDEISDLIEEAEMHLQNKASTVADNVFRVIDIVKSLPSSHISYSDDGERYVKKTIENLRWENTASISDQLDELEDAYSNQNIDFKKVKKLKNDIMLSLRPVDKLIVPKEFNQRVYDLLKNISQSIIEFDATDEESILARYLDAFQNDPYQIRSAIDKFMTVIAATHQKTMDKDIMKKKGADMGSIEYNNVLIDEAARSCPPDLLIPMSCTKDRIVFVGDHKQLPQFINDEVYQKIDAGTLGRELKEEMLKQTMFEFLIDKVKNLKAHDGIERFVTLDTQYRMHPVLGDFVSRNFYEPDGVKLYSGRAIEEFKHSLPRIENKAMVWLDVKGRKGEYEIKKRDGKDIKGYVRSVEAETIARYVKEVLSTPSCKDMTIGIISFYRDQIEEIKKELSKEKVYGTDILVKDEYGRLFVNEDFRYVVKDNEQVERIKIDTVDAFQGLEMDLIILSMTRSVSKYFNMESDRDYFGFLKMKNRLCVALSRQKKCLMVVGDSNMVQDEKSKEKVPALHDFYNTCRKGGEYVELLQF